MKWHTCDEFDQLRGEGGAKHKDRIEQCDCEGRTKQIIGLGFEDANGGLEQPPNEQGHRW